MNGAQRLLIAKMKADVSKRHAEAKTEAERARCEKEWRLILKAERDAHNGGSK